MAVTGDIKEDLWTPRIRNLSTHDAGTMENPTAQATGTIVLTTSSAFPTKVTKVDGFGLEKVYETRYAPATYWKSGNKKDQVEIAAREWQQEIFRPTQLRFAVIAADEHHKEFNPTTRSMGIMNTVSYNQTTFIWITGTLIDNNISVPVGSFWAMQQECAMEWRTSKLAQFEMDANAVSLLPPADQELDLKGRPEICVK